MRAVMVMFDSLNRRMLSPYGCRETVTPNFERLAGHSVQFDTCYAGSLPCMSARRELHTGRYNFLHRSWGPVEPNRSRQGAKPQEYCRYFKVERHSMERLIARR